MRSHFGHGVQRRDDQVGLVDGQPGKKHGRVRCAYAESEQQRDPGRDAYRTGLGADRIETWRYDISINVFRSMKNGDLLPTTTDSKSKNNNNNEVQKKKNE